MIDAAIQQSKAKIKTNVVLVDEFKSPRDQQYARKIKQAVAKKQKT